VVAQAVQPKVYYYLTDHLGTPQKLTDAAGAVVWSGDYKPFGEVVSGVSTIQNHFRFPGQYYDQETALHYNYHRYYRPRIGMYIRPDPLGEDGGLNPYVYVSNRPSVQMDPYGLKECSYCPGGQWDVDMHANANAVLFVGASRTRVTFTCLSNDKQCTGVLDCAHFGLGWDIGVGYSFEQHGEAGNTLGKGTVVSGLHSTGDIKNFHCSSMILAVGPVATSGNNINVGFGASLFYGKQFCVSRMIVCED
jgi:RHS repeat-associated protein